MGLWILSFVLMVSTASASVGKVLKTADNSGAYIIRNKNKIDLKSDLALETGDQVVSGTTNLVLQLYPETQIALTKQTELIIDQADLEISKSNDRGFAVVKLQKGLVKVLIPAGKRQELEQRWETEGMTGAVRQGEFELSVEESKNVKLEVMKGQVDVSSPFIQSFVPEIVKSNEGLTFVMKDKAFSRHRVDGKSQLKDVLINPKTTKKNWDKARAKLAKKK